MLKIKLTHSEAMMAPYPPGHVRISQPFSHCDVDYARSIILREDETREIIRLLRHHFCLAVKAVHLELINNLTSNAFIAAFKRFIFILRRGKPSFMYSDNGTTFVGARNQLKEFLDFLNKSQIQDDVKQFLHD